MVVYRLQNLFFAVGATNILDRSFYFIGKG
jgi:hypothetical protein